MKSFILQKREWGIKIFNKNRNKSVIWKNLSINVGHMKNNGIYY